MFGFDIEAAEMAMLTGWVLYLVIFATPFIQEDVAVIGAATASLAGRSAHGAHLNRHLDRACVQRRLEILAGPVGAAL